MGVYPYGTGVTIREEFTVNGQPQDTTAAWTLTDPNGTSYSYSDGDVEWSHPELGVYQLDLPGTLHVIPGVWRYEIVGSGLVEATSSGEYTILQPGVPVPVAYAQPGPCTPWCDANDVWIACESPMQIVGEGSTTETVPVDMSAYAQAASWLLWELSGKLYSGRCEKTVRPCSDRPCGFQVLDRGHIVWPDQTSSFYGWDGWSWYFNDYGGCGCQPLDRIELSGYPVREVIEVKIDGVVIDPSEYRLDKRRYLTRMAAADGSAQRWPACQRLDMDDDQPGTFSVSYAYGQDPPLFGSLAAAQVACEVYRSAVGGECALPTGTVRVTRQGITIDKLAALGWFRQSSTRYGVQARWQTGLPLVDAFLNTANPFGLSRRPAVATPGNRRGRFAQTVGP